MVTPLDITLEALLTPAQKRNPLVNLLRSRIWLCCSVAAGDDRFGDGYIGILADVRRSQEFDAPNRKRLSPRVSSAQIKASVASIGRTRNGIRFFPANEMPRISPSFWI